MKTWILCTLFTFSFLCNGCAGKNENKPIVNYLSISISNDGKNDLDWVKLDWDGPYVPGGVLLKGISKTAVDVVLPEGDAARLSFVDDKSRKPYEIDFSLEPLKENPENIKEVVIRILDYDKVRLDVVRK